VPAFATSSRNCCERLTAFLKRRWILLSCAIVLTACSAADFGVVAARRYVWGIFDGGLTWFRQDSFPLDGSNADLTWHAPQFHSKYVKKLELPNILGVELPFAKNIGWGPVVRIPLWFSLLVLIGWIIVSELRRREKRAKAAEGGEA
jgi:hypothetical protein